MHRYDQDQYHQIDRIKDEYEHKLYNMRKTHEDSMSNLTKLIRETEKA